MNASATKGLWHGCVCGSAYKMGCTLERINKGGSYKWLRVTRRADVKLVVSGGPMSPQAIRAIVIERHDSPDALMERERYQEQCQR